MKNGIEMSHLDPVAILSGSEPQRYNSPIENIRA